MKIPRIVAVSLALLAGAPAFALAQGAGPLGYAREEFLAVQLGANLFLALGIIAAALHADRTSPRRTLTFGALLAVDSRPGAGTRWRLEVPPDGQ